MSHNPAVFDEQSYTEHLKQHLGTTVVKRPLNSTSTGLPSTYSICKRCKKSLPRLYRGNIGRHASVVAR